LIVGSLGHSFGDAGAVGSGLAVFPDTGIGQKALEPKGTAELSPSARYSASSRTEAATRVLSRLSRRATLVALHSLPLVTQEVSD